MLNRRNERANSAPTRCDVRECGELSREWFTVEQPTFNVCRTHGLRLRAGESHTANGAELRVGVDNAGELLGVRWSKTAEATVMVLKLGHDGVVNQEVPIQVTPQLGELLRAIGDARTIDSDTPR